MKTVNVATLKQELSAYLRLVKGGDEVVVTSHRLPVARLIQATGPENRITCRPPTRSVAELKNLKTGVVLTGMPGAVEALLQDRSRR